MGEQTIPEILLVFHACSLGIWLVFIYDGMRIFRRLIPHGRFLTGLEDLIFWIYCTVKVFLFLYHMSSGKIRWFSIAGAFFGMYFFEKALGRHIVNGISKAAVKMKKKLTFCHKVLK